MKPQKLPGFIRWPVRAFLLPFILLDLAMQKMARILIPPPFVKTGQCKKRGTCCQTIMIRKPKGFWGWAFKVWNTEFNGFYLKSNETFIYDNHKVMVMGCRYLQKDGSCKHYTLRPLVCRKWPVIEHFGTPRIIKGCGYSALDRKTKKPLQIVED